MSSRAQLAVAHTVVVELTLARGFPLSTPHLLDAVGGRRVRRLRVDTEGVPPPHHVVRALRAMERQGAVRRATWPGPERDGHTYWVLPCSPWACHSAGVL